MPHRKADAPGWRSEGVTAAIMCGEQHHDTPSITYRAEPHELSTNSIVAELLYHIGDAETWAGNLGRYARQRAERLRAELHRREHAS